jgi:hypothetical protein
MSVSVTPGPANGHHRQGHCRPRVFLYDQGGAWQADWLPPVMERPTCYTVTLFFRWRWECVDGRGQVSLSPLDVSVDGASGALPVEALQELDVFLSAHWPGIPPDLVRAWLAQLKTPQLEAV